MWNSLSGELTRKGLDQIFLASGDVEWDIAVSRHTLDTLPPQGARARIYTFLHHTEDSMRLFGFSTIQERALFLDLIRVSGVGPKLGLRILSGMKYTEILASLEAGDAERLAKAPGVGLKTAQKIVLALKGKLTLLEDSQRVPPLMAEIIASLSEMGFDRKAAEKALGEHWNDGDLEGLGEAEREQALFQRALVRLSRES